jgi:hypothetical protein
MVLIFAWVSLAFLPWFIALTSYDQIAGDLHLRTIRYAALRTTRGAYVAGKLARAGRRSSPASPPSACCPSSSSARSTSRASTSLATVASLLSTWPITLVCALGFLGIVSLASQLCRTPRHRPGRRHGPPAARLVLASCRAVWASARSSRCSRRGTGSPACSTPTSPRACSASPPASACALGYTALGYLRFRRSDL